MRGWLTSAAITLAAAVTVVPVSARAPASPHSRLGGQNLIANGDAESGSAARRVGDPSAPPPGWSVSGAFSQVSYGAADFPDAADSHSVAGGGQFLAGGPGGPSVSTARQTVDVGADAAAIDEGGVRAGLGAAIGGFGLQGDYGVVDATFLDGGDRPLARMRIGPVTVDDRGGLPVGDFEGYGHTELVRRSGVRLVPPGTRSISVLLSAVRRSGTYGDGYFDDVSLSLRTSTAPAPPSVGRTLLASTVDGRVLVRRPGERHARRLTRALLLPMHTRFDARRGSVRITSAANALGGLQAGVFRGAQFSVGQRRVGRPYTVLTLRGGNLRSCASGTTASASRSRRRHLFGRARGHFRSRGRHSSATVRGTTWDMDDSCAGTSTAVRHGKIDVHDFERDALVPIARGVEPDNTEHDPEPVAGCPPACPVQAAPPGRRAGSRYVAGRGR